MHAEHFNVDSIEKTVLHVPFHERCAHHMEVYGPGWSIVELIQVETKGGIVGVGETIQSYTWGHSGEDEFARARNHRRVRVGLDFFHHEKRATRG